jgi:hypothetical protein
MLGDAFWSFGDFTKKSSFGVRSAKIVMALSSFSPTVQFVGTVLTNWPFRRIGQYGLTVRLAMQGLDFR